MYMQRHSSSMEPDSGTGAPDSGTGAPDDPGGLLAATSILPPRSPAKSAAIVLQEAPTRQRARLASQPERNTAHGAGPDLTSFEKREARARRVLQKAA